MSAAWRLCLCGGVFAVLAFAFYDTLLAGAFGITSLMCMLAAGSAGSRLLAPKVRELREARQRRRELECGRCRFWDGVPCSCPVPCTAVQCTARERGAER